MKYLMEQSWIYRILRMFLWDTDLSRFTQIQATSVRALLDFDRQAAKNTKSTGQIEFLGTSIRL